ncbi:MAG: TraX family protein [Hominenteromicrobium sp.]
MLYPDVRPLTAEKCRETLNANQLKLIAVLAMVLDHCTTLFLPDGGFLSFALHAVGQLAAPIMCFLIAEGYFHTSNLRRYLGRLLLSALVSHVPYALCFKFPVTHFWLATSVMWSLFLGLLAAAIWHMEIAGRLCRVLAVGACCLLAVPGNWNYIAVLWILAFAVFRGDERKQWLAFAAVSMLYPVQLYLHGSTLSIWLCPFVLLAIPLLARYNRRLGRKSKLLQWGYYLFYPLHFMVLCVLRALIARM